MRDSHLSNEEMKALLHGLGEEEQPSETGLVPETGGLLLGDLSGKKRLGLGIFNLFRDFRRGRFSHLQWSKSVYRQLLSSNSPVRLSETLFPCSFNLWLNDHKMAIEAISPSFLQELSHQHQSVHKMAEDHLAFHRATSDFLDLFYEESLELFDILSELDKKVSVYLAYRDPLTEVYSQEMIAPLLRTELNRIKRAGHSSSLAMLNVASSDQTIMWKGEEEKNIVLSEVASFLVRATRPYDFILRVNEGSFLCVFPETNVKTATPIVDRLRQGLRKISLDGLSTPLEMKMTIGLSLLSPQVAVGKNLKRADTALENARKNGEGSICILDEDETPSFLS
ncbi:MAG: GGDEF domain-containing protein [Leptospirales bacterium]